MTQEERDRLLRELQEGDIQNARHVNMILAGIFAALIAIILVVAAFAEEPRHSHDTNKIAVWDSMRMIYGTVTMLNGNEITIKTEDAELVRVATYFCDKSSVPSIVKTGSRVFLLYCPVDRHVYTILGGSK